MFASTMHQLKSMVLKAQSILRQQVLALRTGKRWAKKTLVVGPVEPVDGDSVACTSALLNHLRSLGLEAFTLPTASMHRQLAWMLTSNDLHPATHPLAGKDLTCSDLQAAYDAMLAVWRPDEIVLVDGGRARLGFDPRGVPVYVIDHHMDKGAQDDEHGFIQPASSAGVHLIKRYRIYDPILVVSIMTDTFWLRQNYPAQAIEALAILRANGLTDEQMITIQSRLFVAKDPHILDAINAADTTHDHDTVFAVLKDASPEIHRGVMGEFGYFYTNICVVRADGYVSFKTRNRNIDLRPLAKSWGGGGHSTQAAGKLSVLDYGTLARLRSDFLQVVK